MGALGCEIARVSRFGGVLFGPIGLSCPVSRLSPSGRGPGAPNPTTRTAVLLILVGKGRLRQNGALGTVHSLALSLRGEAGIKVLIL